MENYNRTLVEEFAANESTRIKMVTDIRLRTVRTWCGAQGMAACGSQRHSLDAQPRSDSSRFSTQHLVGVGYHETNQITALNNALEQTIGLDHIQRGDSVYLRVNSNSGDFYPYSTSPLTLAAIGGMLHDVGVTDIRIGDRSFWGDPDTAGNLRKNGIADAAQRLGTTALVFDDAVEWITLPPQTLPSWKGTVRIPKLVASATHYINLACVKTHFIAHITMCLKISLGIINAHDRQRVGNLDTHVQARLWNQIAETNKNITPSLNILDGYQAVITGGPTIHDRPPFAPNDWHAATAESKVFVVSTDRIAADVTGAAILQTLSPPYEEVQRHAPFQLPQIQAAIAAGGLGISGPDALDIAGPTVPQLAEYRRKAIAS
jgi:uncharacterized protein (DUF362 family)